MPRRLPWITGSDSGEAFRRKRTPVQHERPKRPISSDEDVANKLKPHQTSPPTKSLSKTRVRKRETSRTPSTSPPPAPPPTELMHEGYHADDIFMMVEDEFQTVAQTFTHHLHYAEYVRLKKKARATPFPAVTQTINGVHTETKKKLEANHLRERQSVAIKSMVGRASRAEDEQDEEAQGKDSWQGTSLAGLMAKDSTQKRTALVGLEQIPSATRAAKGFGRGNGDSRTKRQESRSILEIYGGRNRKKSTASPVIGSLIEEAEEYEGDDLDAPPRTKEVTRCGKRSAPDSKEALNRKAYGGRGQPSLMSIGPPSPPDSRSEDFMGSKVRSTTTKPSSKFSTSSLRRTVDSSDDFQDEDPDELSSQSKSFFRSARKPRFSEKSAKEKGTRSRLDEIPTFLV